MERRLKLGELLILERGSERLEIEKPEDPLMQKIFMKIVTGSTVSDIGVHMLMHPNKPPRSAEENDVDVIPRRA